MNINYHNKIFKAKINSVNGQVSNLTRFFYKQDKNIVSAEYFGGEILKGFLVGLCDEDGNLKFTYQHVSVDMKIKTGKCFSTPEVLEDGRIKLYENWQWTCDDKSKGLSELIECRG